MSTLENDAERKEMIMRNSRRDDLMVTMGARAAYMECIGNITLPKGVDGEYEL